MRPSSRGTAFVAALRPGLRQAAAVARALEGRVSNRPKRGEASAVKAALTSADIACQEVILTRILERFADFALDAEERTETVARFPERGSRLVVLDPIDGTLRSYLRGDGPYSVLIGLASGRRYEAALVALPREGLFFDAVRGGGARVSGMAGSRRIAVAIPGARRILVSHTVPDAATRLLRKRGYEVSRASGGAISIAPLIPGVCAGLRIARSNRRGVSRRGRVGLLIAREAGLLVRARGKGAFPDDLDAPAAVLKVAAAEEHMAVLDEAIRRAD